MKNETALRVGYLIPEFPGQTHIFFWRELSLWRQWGVSVRLFSTRRPKDVVCRHDFVEAGIAETRYLFPPRFFAALGILLSRPAASTAAIRYIRGLKGTKWWRRVKVLGLLMCAADLCDQCQRDQITHVHAHSCGDSAHILALCRLLGGPKYSLTLHGDLSVYGTDHASKMRSAEFVSTAGNHLKRQIIDEIGIDAQRILPSCMGLDTAGFTADGRNESPAGKLRLLTVARLHPAKGHRHALAAIKRAVELGHDIQYIIAGEGAERANIEAAIRANGLTDRVVLVGTVGQEQVLELLRQADAFVLPSVGLGEAFPVSVMEAMSTGLPVICSIIGATPDMIDDGVSGILVKMGDEQGLCDAMIRLSNDPELRMRIGAAARQKAVSSFDQEITARRLLKEIQKYAAGQSENEFVPEEKLEAVER